ncbi:hypothetical protein [Pedobacter sp. P26]|uniref:hypothetical protein n=1 Tax=Pedobacter sp. P26 TaxID=3423956 RepID=UPI003D677C2C
MLLAFIKHQTPLALNKYVRKSLKILLWVIASIIILVVGVALSLNIPAVQNFVKGKAINYLKNKTKTEVSLESIKIAFTERRGLKQILHRRSQRGYLIIC